jgi:hypothetical protein
VDSVEDATGVKIEEETANAEAKTDTKGEIQQAILE